MQEKKKPRIYREAKISLMSPMPYPLRVRGTFNKNVGSLSSGVCHCVVYYYPPRSALSANETTNIERGSCWVPNGHYGPGLYYKMSEIQLFFKIHSDNIVELK